VNPVPTRRHDDEDRPTRASNKASTASNKATTASRKDTATLSAADAAAAAVSQLDGLIAKQPMSVTSVQPAEGGWFVDIEVVEDRRVPTTSDMLALYEVELDPTGRLQAYRRTRRYRRGTPNGKEAS
jgi:hypothetical protein